MRATVAEPPLRTTIEKINSAQLSGQCRIGKPNLLLYPFAFAFILGFVDVNVCNEGAPPAEVTDMFKCFKCKNRKTSFYQLQTRGAPDLCVCDGTVVVIARSLLYGLMGWHAVGGGTVYSKCWCISGMVLKRAG